MPRALLLLLVLALSSASCEYALTIGGPSTTNTNTNTSTNTNTNNNDRSDTGPTPTPAPDTGTPTPPIATPLPLPTNAEAIALALAAANPVLVSSACTEWSYLDVLVTTLRAYDARWGYLCKDATCNTFGRDVIAYRAGAAETGVWIVDVLFDHCGPTMRAQWLPLPFDTLRRWSATRH